MTTYRDIILKQKDKLDDKQDRLLFKRAVLTTEGGLQTSSDPFNDVWANSSLRRVFYMAEGSVQPAQILCRKISDPYVGLGVIIGYADGSNQLEVLSDDFFLTKTGDPTGWASTSPRDFEPGGRKQMWVYTKVITPLATYPGSGVAVNVILGDYPYLGTRKSFTGSVNYDLSASVPGGGLCRYAGLYLDASNTLQTVNGSTAAAGTTPPEPSWPAGAFRLCVVLLTNGDTSIDFANIIDRRMAWSDEEASGGWPFDRYVTVSQTNGSADYTTVQSAINGISSGFVILLDDNVFIEDVTVNKNCIIAALKLGGNTRPQLAGNFVVTAAVTAFAAYGLDFAINSSPVNAITVDLTAFTNCTATFQNCTITCTSGTNRDAVRLSGTGTLNFYDTTLSATGVSGNRYGLNVTGTSASLSVNAYRGTITGNTKNITGASTNPSVILFDPVMATGLNSDFAGIFLGSYRSASGAYFTLPNTRWTMGDGATTPPVAITARSAAPSTPAAQDIYLDDGTNYANAKPGFRRYTGAAWVDISDFSQLLNGVWLFDESAGLKIKETTLAAAIAASANGDSIKLDTDTYSVAASQNIDTSITIEGDGPEATIYTTSVSNATAFDITTNSITVVFKDLTIKHTGGGVAATGIFSNNTGVTVVLDNAVVEISSGAGTTSRGLWIEAGTWILRNGSKIVVTSGTSKYAIYNDAGAVTVTLGAGCALNGAAADIYSDQSGSTFNFDGVALLNNIMDCAAAINGFCLDSKYRNAGFVAVNNSGATRAAGDVCDIDVTGKLTTTTTATAILSWTIVSIGNTNANQCFVRRQGRVTCGYTGTDPSAGHFLVTSTSAGLGQRQTTMRPEIYAVCTAAGSSGVVEAMLLTTRVYETNTDIHFIYGIEAASDSDFVATINGAPSGTSVVYNAPSSGSDNTIVPWAALDGSNFNAKTVLWNTTRGTSALISSVNTGTKTITLTAAVPAGWANTDTITARSQTNTQNWSGGAYYFEWDISGWAAKPALATAIVIESSISDTSATVAALSSFHPFEAFVASKNFQRWSQAGAANVRLLAPVTVPILSNKFTLGWDATGSATTTVFGSLAGWIVAAP